MVFSFFKMLSNHLRSVFNSSSLRIHFFKYSSYRYLSNKESTDNKLPKPNLSQQQQQQQQQLKQIDAKVIKESANQTIVSTKTLNNLRGLSSKNFILKKLLHRPIAIIEWLQLPKHEKQNSGIRFVVWWIVTICSIILAQLLHLYFCWSEHEITERHFLRTQSKVHNDLHEDLVLQEIYFENEGKFLDSSTSAIKMCDEILRNLIKSNQEHVKDENIDPSWSAIIFDDGKTIKSQAISSAKFFVLSKKLYDLCDNQHQVAYLIAHELSHVILKHYREPLSNIKPYQVLDGEVLAFYPLLFWAFNPGEALKVFEFMKYLNKLDEGVRDYLHAKYKAVLDRTAYSDTLEEEADRIALQLLSRACYDIREVEKFMNKCRKLAADLDVDDLREKYHFIFKHKLNAQEKLEYLKKNLEKFIKFRMDCGCPPLK